MSTRIVVVFANRGGADWPFHLDATESNEEIGITLPDYNEVNELTDAFKQARNQAYDMARQSFGGADFHPGVACVLKRIGAPDHPPLSGDSLYGAMAMAAIQVFANGTGAGREGEMRYQVRSQLKAMRFADLSTVAVSAGVGTAGDFSSVKGMDLKLKSLATVCWPERLSVIVLARGQRVLLPNKDPGAQVDTTPEEYLHSQELPEIPLIYAYDAIDALGQVYERQCKEKAQAYERRCKALAERIA